MRLRIERARLLNALSHVQNVVERRTTIPILANVKLEAQADELLLTATDQDVALALREPAAVEAPGATTVGARTLFELVRKLPEGAEVSLAHRGDADAAPTLVLEAGRARIELPTLPAQDFPPFGEEALDVRFQLATADLARLIDKTRFAISTEETRYYLNGIHLHVHGREAAAVLRAVATDGHRLARIELALPEGAAAMPPIIVPRKTVQEARKLVEEGSGEVVVEVSLSRIRFAVDGRVLTSRLIDSSFPDYEKVIPKEYKRCAELSVKEFRAAVDLVSTISTDRSRTVKLSFKDETVVISSTSAEVGSATESVDVSYEGDPLDIGFNARYILDMLQEVESDRVRLEMNSEVEPIVMRDPGDASLLYVLMPVRV